MNRDASYGGLTHDWQRYWTPPDEAISLADEGFLVPPGDGVLSGLNPNLRTFAQIDDHHCLVLLGEPGMGKTKALRAEAAWVGSACAGTTDDVLSVDLGSTSDERTLCDRIFANEQYERWRRGDHILHVFLDSLDEAVLRLGVVADMLLDGLRGDGVDVGRLRMRLACRTADRIRELEAGLHQLWGEEQFGAFELAPLTRADVRLAAGDRDQNPDNFVAELVDRDIVPLAIKPVTLDLLLDSAQAGGGLPASQLDLYGRGLRVLVSERERRARDPTIRGEVDVGRRLAIASRIAAATLLTGRPVIVRNVAAELSDEHVLVRQLAGGKEWDHELGAAVGFEVTTAAVDEVLNTGLFSARGEDLGWAHQTYGEFLAAQYLVASKLGKERVMSILASPGDPQGRIVPQLRDVAAWAAVMDGALLDELASRDPLVLLRGDLGLANDDQREAERRSAVSRGRAGIRQMGSTRATQSVSPPSP